MTDFLGRDSELTVLRSAIDASRTGHGGLFLITGEAGIGKTRLAEEACGHATAGGQTVLWGRCVELEGSPAYWPWIQVLRELAAHPPRASLISELGVAAAEISRLVPGFLGRAGRSQKAPAGDGDRFRLLDAISQLLRLASSPSGLVVVLDDLQWSDRPSLTLLRHLSAQLPGFGLLVITTYRDVELGRRHPLIAMLPQLSRERSVRRLKLSGLDVDDVSRVLIAAGTLAVQPGLAATVHERTGGNPFFVVELARLLGQEGTLGRAVLPQGVREVIGQRLDMFSERCNQVLRIAALLDRDFDLEALAETARMPVEDLLEALDEAVAGAVVVARRDPPGRYSFLHDLVRETLYEELPTPMRVQLHRLAAESLERRMGSTAALAYHWFEAAPAGGWDRAASYAARAAAESLEQLAYEEAARLYRMALDALIGRSGQELRRCQLLLDLAGAQYSAGELAASLDSCSAAAELARVMGRADLQAAAALVVQGVDDEWVQPMLRRLNEQALDSLGAENPALRARLFAQLAALHESLHQPQAVETLSRKAMELAEQAGDTEASLAAIHARHAATTGPDGGEERLSLGARLVEIARHSDRPVEEAWGRLWRVDACFQLGDTAVIRSELSQLEVLADRLRQPLFRWHWLRGRAALAHLTGAFDDAQQLNEEALYAGRAGQQTSAGMIHLSVLAAIGLERGTREAMERFVAMVEQVQSQGPAVHAFVLTLELALGRREDAAERFGRLMVEFPQPPNHSSWFPTVARLADAACELGMEEQRTGLYESLAPYGRYFTTDGAGVDVCVGCAARSLGTLAASIGRWDHAERHLEEAVELNRLAGAIPFVAHSQLDLAEVLHRKSGSGRARELARSAQRTAASLGMKPLQERARILLAELERTGPRLTARELEIVGLVARGLSNREIAERLHLSERTAENHVKHVLDKLGFSSRAQIAAWAVAEGVLSRQEIEYRV